MSDWSVAFRFACINALFRFLMLNNVLENDAFHEVPYPGISMFLQVPVV